MDATQLSAIRERVDAATAGPWSLAYWYHTKSAHGLGRYVQRPEFAGYESFTDADEALIADAPTDLAALLDEVERLHTALAFYADEANWKTRVIYEAPAPGAQMWKSGPAADRGAAARAALRTDPEEEE
jgi:hypothetical protein